MGGKLFHYGMGILLALTALAQFFSGESVAGAILLGALFIGSAIEEFAGTLITIDTPEAVEVERG